jgi:hypothetical protein
MLDTHSLVAFLGDKCVLICSLFRALSRTLAALPNLLYTALLDLSGLTFTKKRASKNNKRKHSKHSLPHPHLDLFNQPIVYNSFIASSTSTPYLRQCAVSEFDYDFSSPNPYSWDFQNLVLNSQGPAALHQGPDQQPVPLVKHHHQPQHQDYYQHQQQQQQQQQNQHPHPLRNEYEYDQDHDQEDQQDSEADLLAKFNSNFHTQLRQTELYQIQAQQQQYQENLHQHQYQQAPVTTYIDSDVDSDDDAGYDDPPPLDDELMLSFFRSNRDTDAYINSSDDHVSPLEDPTSGSASGSVSITSSNNTPIRVEINNLKRDIEGLDRHHYSESDNVNVNSNSDGDGDIKLEEKSLSNSDTDQPKCSRPRKKQRKCDTDLEDNADSDEDTHTNRSGRSKPFRVSGEKIYPCSICNATFKVKGYLTRHKKKHATSKPFHCPYFDPSTDYDEHALVHDTSNDSGDIGDGRPRCHPTGGFSRRDTFKTHLKAIHFVYPTGTKSGDRSDKKGRCAACFKEFNSNKTWLESHVMTNSCEGMITRYK